MSLLCILKHQLIWFIQTLYYSQTLYYYLLLQKQTQDISLLSAFELSNIVPPPNSLYSVCLHACICLCVCVGACACVYKIIYACARLSRCVNIHILFSFFFYDIHYLDVQVCI